MKIRISLKLCGFCTKGDLEQLRGFESKIDALGFLFVPGRRRTIMIEDYQEIASFIPIEIKRVAVFQNTSFSMIQQVLSLGSFDWIQFHGAESSEFIREIRGQFSGKVIRAVSPDQPEIIDELSQQSNRNLIDILLLDQGTGGTGQVFDWSSIPKYQLLTNQYGWRLWIAGGIHAGNIEELLTSYEIDGVDIASGIEIEGKKDYRRIGEIVERMKKYGVERKSSSF